MKGAKTTIRKAAENPAGTNDSKKAANGILTKIPEAKKKINSLSTWFMNRNNALTQRFIFHKRSFLTNNEVITSLSAFTANTLEASSYQV